MSELSKLHDEQSEAMEQVERHHDAFRQVLSRVARFERVIDDMRAERVRQDQLKAEGRFPYTCADPELSNFHCLTVLTEEVGEVARAVLEAEKLANDSHGKELRKELIQVATVCLAWVEGLDQETQSPPVSNDADDDGA